MSIKKLFLNDIIFQSMIKLIILIFKHLKSNLQIGKKFYLEAKKLEIEISSFIKRSKL